MTTAYIGPDPDAGNIRLEIPDRDVLDAVAYALNCGPYTSAEVRRDATLRDILHGNGRVAGHFGSSSPEYYKRHDDPEWAVIHDPSPFDPERGRELLEPLIAAQAGAPEKEDR